MWEGNVLNGKYRVERVIASGRGGLVVAAIHLRLGQRVALRFLQPEVLSDREAVERFPRELRGMGRLDSEHAARIIDVDVLDSGAPFVVVEYLEGVDLAAVLRRDGALPVPVIAVHVMQALDALADELASGRVPFASRVFSELLLMVVTQAAPPMPSRERLPDGFEAVVRRCLEKDPARRFQTVAELAAALVPFAPAGAGALVGRIRDRLDS